MKIWPRTAQEDEHDKIFAGFRIRIHIRIRMDPH
jgi:hypothetical protein